MQRELMLLNQGISFWDSGICNRTCGIYAANANFFFFKLLHATGGFLSGAVCMGQDNRSPSNISYHSLLWFVPQNNPLQWDQVDISTGSTTKTRRESP